MQAQYSTGRPLELKPVGAGGPVGAYWPRVAYAIEHGRLLTWALEAHAVDHCNLRCVHCCTLSPRLAERFLDPRELERDLALAARVLRPAIFKLTGGEPLLHPGLTELLDVARASGISPQLSLTTNGLLLERQPDALFERLERLTLSLYSSAPLPEGALERVEARCREHGLVLTVKRISRFARMDAPARLEPEQAHQVHAACWLKVRCHMLRAGRFYACTRPPHLQQALAARGLSLPLARQDGLALEGQAAALLSRLADYLERAEPLASCSFCLGASGAWEPHAQDRRKAGRAAGALLP